MLSSPLTEMRDSAVAAAIGLIPTVVDTNICGRAHFWWKIIYTFVAVCVNVNIPAKAERRFRFVTHYYET